MPYESQDSNTLNSNLPQNSPFSLQGMATAMEVEQPLSVLPSSSTPASSPHLRSSLSGHASSQSVGSSLDTASASAHLERYEIPWSFSDLGILRRGIRPRTRSYSAVLEWNSTTPSGRHHSLRNSRPLAGTSRKRLIRQIQQLTKDKAELEAQLAAIAMGGSASTSSSGARVATVRGERGSSSGSAGEGVAVEGANAIASTSTGQIPANPYPFMDGLVGFPSTLAGPEQKLDTTSPASLEHISALASRLRVALETATIHLLDEDDAALLDRPGMKSLLVKEPPHPERAQLYARFFSLRFIELQKKPEDRCTALQPGPLQRNIKHPGYVNILMKELREPFIAHMGAFDEAEFGLWILNGVEFHSEALKDTEEEIGVLDDDFYEFSNEFFQRFPFTGTKANIENANRWRTSRGEPLLEQTSEMAAAEDYTCSKQRRIEQANPSTSNPSSSSQVPDKDVQ